MSEASTTAAYLISGRTAALQHPIPTELRADTLPMKKRKATKQRTAAAAATTDNELTQMMEVDRNQDMKHKQLHGQSQEGPSIKVATESIDLAQQGPSQTALALLLQHYRPAVSSDPCALFLTEDWE
ncbi:hypothetical protein BGZ54_000088 [Gamsiella multidivaricata]|nr:hypothetical protein BGZ54_000088 [Gamsiella multidivaricata]